jgi:hypothetical protein
MVFTFCFRTALRKLPLIIADIASEIGDCTRNISDKSSSDMFNIENETDELFGSVVTRLDALSAR